MEISLQLDALTHLHAIPEPTKVNPLSLTISSDEGWLSSHLTRLMYVCTWTCFYNIIDPRRI